ncbi:MAG TPA: ABC-type transport auxiliary lipoprotein family protein [Stellaceae bacterium]|nr:ABC-type transport auxiliary lipoprotein family protein [Stellaceae bacterium]
MTTWLRLVAAAMLLLLAASCGGILPAPPPAPRLFRLTSLAPAASVGPPISLQLVVAAPTAPAAFDTQRVALARGPNSIDYFADAAWTDQAPLMLQGLIVESLKNAGRFRVVALQSAAVRADVVLTVDLRRFEADYSGAGPPDIRVAFDGLLVRMPERSVIATRTFAASAPAAKNETQAIVAAFDAAFHAAMAQMVPWAADVLATPAR